MRNGRVCIVLMDSFGIGASADAERYGDAGGNTLGHIIEACEKGRADQAGVRQGKLCIPNLAERGLYWALLSSCGVKYGDESCYPKTPSAAYGYAVEKSLGKDTPSGHWEIAGLPVEFAWGYFPNTPECFPKPLIEQLIQKANLPGVLGEKHASGTEIIKELGLLHQKTGKPIVYTSADSVLQIAAHEESFGLERLYEVCKIARKLVDPYAIGRVIARPFVGEGGNYRRTANRHDYATPPHQATLLDDLKKAGREVIAIGKTADIFAHSGVTQSILADGNMALFDATLKALKTAPDGSLIFANFVDFDSSYGHRRDVAGYAHALEQFDKRLPELNKLLQPKDWVVITADHGCDPTFTGTDHTREHIPVLAYGPSIQSQCIGRRETFADIGQTIAHALRVPPLAYGIRFF